MERNIKIKNIPPEISISQPIFCIAAGIVFFLLVFVFLADYKEDYPGLLNFFSWYQDAFKAVMNGNAPAKLKIYIPILSYASVGCFFAGVFTFFTRKTKFENLNRGKFLKSVEFLDDGVKFNYNKSHFNFTVGFPDIKELKYIIHTCVRNGGYGSVLCVDNKKIVFYLKDETVVELNPPMTAGYIKLGYTLIDFARNIKKYSCEFEGSGDMPEAIEKFNDYKEKGFKQVLSSHQESNYKKNSLTFFIIGIVVMLAAKFCIPDKALMTYALWFIPIIASPFLLISFFFDLYIFVDKLVEKFSNEKL